VERSKLLKRIQKLKTLKGRKKYLKRLRGSPELHADEIAFNVGSNAQLAELFVTVLGIVPKFFSATGQPSLRSVMLHQFGEGGTMLAKRRKRILVQKQVQSLYELTEFTGRWHLDLRAAGTSTGRFSGGKH
jgi:DNA polymerase I-like protein with 3'-5' exonuclease and polymerase domains